MRTLPGKHKRSFHERLHRWYGQHGRHDLPWRNTTDPYAIYISEVMLQQTQVQTVLSRFYLPFLKRFPTLQALADAPRDAVLKQWEGLGYYSRAVNLHKAAQLAAPRLPDTVDALLALPGIGRNTAHAVTAFAYHQPLPVMEANVKRVLCRVFALETPSTEQLWQLAFMLLDEKNPFDYNQAMMDIGAMICTRSKPACGVCPAEALCEGKSEPQKYPARRVKKPVPVRKAHIIVWRDAEGRCYLRPRETAFLGGLYGFAEYNIEQDDIYFYNTRYCLTKDAENLGQVSQTYSHFRMDAQLWQIQLDSAAPHEPQFWHSLADIASLAISGIDQKILELLPNSGSR